MVGTIGVRFLGTSSQPSESRNYSSLLVKLDREGVLVDCGEGTQQQLMKRRIGGGEKLAAIHTVLVTHLHADHVLGIVPLLYSMMGPSAASTSTDKPRVEIFGPLGLRALIRTQVTLCYAGLTGRYVVHELLWPGQEVTSSAGPPASQAPSAAFEPDIPMLGAVNGPRRAIPDLPIHEAELPGRSIYLDEATATWQDFHTIAGVRISASPILHRCPCVGYVFQEPTQASPLPSDTFQRLDANADRLLAEQGIRNARSLVGRLIRDRQSINLPDGTTMHPPPLDVPGRKLCICGDTNDATGGLTSSSTQSPRGLCLLAQQADLLIHESTNAALPSHLSPGKATTEEETRLKAASRGHSTPAVAGTFAGLIQAKSLVLNHFSVRYPAPRSPRRRGVVGGGGEMDDRHARVMEEMERQATEAWHTGLAATTTMDTSLPRAVAAFDGLYIEVPRSGDKRDSQSEGQMTSSSSSSVPPDHPPRSHLRFHDDKDDESGQNGENGTSASTSTSRNGNGGIPISGTSGGGDGRGGGGSSGSTGTGTRGRTHRRFNGGARRGNVSGRGSS